MRRTRDAPGGLLWLPVVALSMLATAGPAAAFDLFTLWQQRELDLRIEVGDWADYRSVSIESGRRREGVSRLQCVGEDAEGWRLEVVSVIDTDDGLTVVPGEGWSFLLARESPTARDA